MTDAELKKSLTGSWKSVPDPDRDVIEYLHFQSNGLFAQEWWENSQLGGLFWFRFTLQGRCCEARLIGVKPEEHHAANPHRVELELSDDRLFITKESGLRLEYHRTSERAVPACETVYVMVKPGMGGETTRKEHRIPIDPLRIQQGSSPGSLQSDGR